MSRENCIVNCTGVFKFHTFFIGIRENYQGSYPLWNKTFEDFQGHISHFSRNPFSAKKSLESYPFLVLPQTWAVLSWRSFILGTWKSGLDKVGKEIQGISSTNCNLQGHSMPWIFILNFKHFQGLSRCVQIVDYANERPSFLGGYMDTSPVFL